MPTNANIGFEGKIWSAACELWGHIPAAEYRKVVVGLIFLRYVSTAFEKRYKELIEEGAGFEDEKDAYSEVNVFYLPKEARWSTIAEYEGAKEMLLVDDVDNKEFMKDLLEAMYEELPAPKAKKKR